MTTKTNFKALITSIQEVNHSFAAQASRVVNTSLTLRNWNIRKYFNPAGGN